MIISRISNGLGNQMFQYALGRRLSLEYNTSLKLDLSWYDAQNEHGGTNREYTLNRFNVAGSVANESDLREVLPFGSYARRLARTSLFWSRPRLAAAYLNYYREYEDLPETDNPSWPHHRYFHPAVESFGDDVYLRGYWQVPRYFEPIRDVLQEDFTLELEGKAARLAEVIRESTSIGVHVRRGDFVNQGPGRGNVLDQSYYDRAATSVMGNLADPHVYVFSDDPDWPAENITFDHETTYVTKDYGTTENHDLYLLSLCDHTIVANSTFSCWAAWLNENPDKRVTVPMPWKPYGNYPNDITERWDLTPDEWTVVQW